jgi:hypothetical protein
VVNGQTSASSLLGPDPSGSTASRSLVVYLDSIDERLLRYLDENEDLTVDVVTRLRRYATALFDEPVALGAVGEDSPHVHGPGGSAVRLDHS